MSPDSSWTDKPDDFPTTRLESVDEIRSFLAMNQPRKPTAKEAVPGDPAAAGDAMLLRPVHRPPMAVLVVLDDGQRAEGETIRLRKESFVIGREQGDLIIPHDLNMSRQHAKVAREVHRDQYRWFIQDLNSTNGTFVRISTAEMSSGSEIMIGGKRFRFNAATQGAKLAQSQAGRSNRTEGWSKVNPSDLIPSLRELDDTGKEGPEHFLKGDAVDIGRASTCGIVLDDPFLSPLHARMSINSKGRWEISNQQSFNGVWLRITKLPIDRNAGFMLGEQKFLLRVL
jgi:pSer/pThr/pTyr-binding forkhead associated (FHA) protein